MLGLFAKNNSELGRVLTCSVEYISLISSLLGLKVSTASLFGPNGISVVIDGVCLATGFV